MNTSVEGTTEGGVSSLEAEVAAWRSRRACGPRLPPAKSAWSRIRSERYRQQACLLSALPRRRDLRRPREPRFA